MTESALCVCPWYESINFVTLQADKLERHMVEMTINDLCEVCSNIPMLLEARCGGITLQVYNYLIYAIHLQVFVLFFYSWSLPHLKWYI